MESHNLQLTKMETTVLEALIDGLYAEPGFSDVDAKDLSTKTGISTRSIRGVLSSLSKKEIIWLEETDNMWAEQQYVLIYLSKNFWYLHPKWKEEMNETYYNYYR